MQVRMFVLVAALYALGMVLMGRRLDALATLELSDEPMATPPARRALDDVRVVATRGRAACWRGPLGQSGAVRGPSAISLSGGPDAAIWSNKTK